MKTTGLILLLLTGFSVAAQTNPAPACCRHPLRVFDGQTVVNLNPLFYWWKEYSPANQAGTNRDDSRPLAAWQRITGWKTAVIGSDWVVKAVIQTVPDDTNTARQVIVLKHPPAAEEAWYYELKRRLAAAPQQIAADQHTYETETQAAEKAEAEAKRYNGTGKWAGAAQANNDRQLAANHRAAAAAAQKEQEALQAAYPKAQKELAAMPAVDGRYHIDWFGLELGRNSEGVRIFDLGVVPEKARPSDESH